MRRIQTLWIGGGLGLIEGLCLRSFLAQGHAVDLYAYDQVAGVPEGVALRDAAEVLPRDCVFRYRKGGSVSGFTNWFRYELLHRCGGFWVDTDVICLRPLDLDGELVVGWEDSDSLNGAVLGAEPGQPLLRHLAETVRHPNRVLPYDGSREKRRKYFRRFILGNQRQHLKWGESGPRAITRAMRHFGMMDRALPFTAFYPVHYQCWRSVFDETFVNKMEYFKDSYCVHLWNECMGRDASFDKERDSIRNRRSLFGLLMDRYWPEFDRGQSA